MNMKKVFQVIRIIGFLVNVMELIEIGGRYIKKYRKTQELKTETQPV